MARLRGRVLLAWVFCGVVTVTSLFNAAALVAQANGQLFKLGDVFFALVSIAFALPAALIITRQPRNIVGWLLMINPLVTIPVNAFSLYLSRFIVDPPPATFLHLFMVWTVSLSWMALIFPIFLVPLFFPTGRLISPRWRWTVYLTVGMTLFLMITAALTTEIQLDTAPWTLPNPIGFIPAEAINLILVPWSVLLAVLTVASVAAILIRYRRGSLVERQQMKWLLYACFLFALCYIPSVFTNSGSSQWSTDILFNLLGPFTIMAIPIAVTIAILRYHLFDIDVIIRLTLVYVVLTGLLGLGYLGGIVLVQQVFLALTGQAGDLAVVITTLAIAALFSPLRRRVQTLIDRRFFREKYNAEQTLAQFSVAARGSADLDALTSMLLEITRDTLQPAHVSLSFIKKREPFK